MSDIAAVRPPSDTDGDAAILCSVPSTPPAGPAGWIALALSTLEARFAAGMRSVSVRKVVRGLGAAVALGTALSIPIAYGVSSYLKEAEVLTYRAELSASRLASAVSEDDSDWHADTERMRAALVAADGADIPMARRIYDAKGHALFELDPGVQRPMLQRAAPVVVSGAVVGRVELTASLLPLLTASALIAVLTLLLGACAYVIFAVLPIKLIDRAFGELQAAGEKSRRQALMLDTALENMVQGLAMYDKDERIVIANDRYAELFGLLPDQVKPGTTLREVVEARAARGHYPGQEAAEVYRVIHKRLLRRQNNRLLSRLPDGRVLAAFVQPNADGGCVVTHQDVTERENLHALLARQNSRLRQGEEQLKEQCRKLDAAVHESRTGLAVLDAALNNMTHGLCMFDAERRLVVCNKVYLDMYGFEAEDVRPGMSVRELIEKRRDRGLITEHDAALMLGDWRADCAEKTRIQKLSDGRIICVRRHVRTGGGFVITHEDISERHRLEQAERDARELLTAVFDATPVAIVCLDPRGNVMSWSRGAERMFGFTAAEVEGAPYPLVPDGAEDEYHNLFQRALHGETFYAQHVLRRHKDGRLLEVSFASSAMLNADGSVRGIAYALSDISESERLRKRLKEQHEQLDIALNNMSQGLAMFDADQHLVVCNNLYGRMFGLSPDQVKSGTTLGEIVQFREANGCHDLDGGRPSHEQPVSGATHVRSGIQRLADGRVIQVSCRKVGGGHVITHQDITESERLNARLEQQHRQLKEQEELLRAQNLQLDAALNNMVQGLAMFDADRELVICNKRYQQMYALSDDEVLPGTSMHVILGNRLSASGLVKPTAEKLIQSFTDASSGGGQITTEFADGRSISVCVQPMAGGGMLTTHQDITEQRRSEAKIVHMALHDTLTGLPNRVLLNERLEQALARVRRGEVVAVQLLDLDYFKSVNDTLGHAAGDKLLKMVADRLRPLVRETDTIARMGGDEFAILQVGLDAASDATSLAHRVIDAVSRPYEIDGHQVVIGTSVGISVGPADGLDPDQLTKHADLALYRAKGEGRGTFCFFEPEMDAQMQARRAMEYDLRKALVAGEFELHYQPVLNLGSEEVAGMEALIRWRHPRQGMIPPSEFIPLAEEIGFIVQLGEWAVQEACACAAGWPVPLTVSVNISPAQFRNPGLLQMVAGALSSAGLPSDRLELEITESVLLGDSEATLATLYQLRELGVRVAMDDFGTGYSSLSYLQSFPFDKIKIDRSFVKDITEGVGSLNIVRAVTALAHGLGMATTAEGVETPAQLDVVRSEGCTEVQGFLFSQPMPAQEVEQFLQQRREAHEVESGKSAA